MFRALLRRWSPKLSRQSRTGLSSRATRFQPQIQPLEDRCLMAAQGLTGFPGLAAPDGSVEPPDSIGVAGPSIVVELVNSVQDSGDNVVGSPQIAFFDKNLGGVVFQQDFKTFFASVNPGNDIFDPVVIFDEQVGRFVLAAVDLDAEAQRSFLDIAISKNSNPVGPQDFELQRLEVTEQTGGGASATRLWGDFPRLGWNADAYVFSLNMFAFPVGEAFAGRSQIVTINKASVIDGDQGTFTFNRGIDVPNAFTLVPAIMHGSQPGGPMYFVEETPRTTSQATSVQVYRMTNVLSSTPNLQPFTVDVPDYFNAVPPAQPNGVSPDPTIDTRILSVAFRNNRLVASHNVGTGANGVTLARWYDFNVAGNRPTLTQAGDISQGAGVSTYYPSIEIAPNGTLGMTFLQSGPNEVMSMYVTGRTDQDEPGLMQTPLLAKAGVTNYQGGRAGDYSGISVDPVDPTTFWAVNQFADQAKTTDNWATWIAQFQVVGTDPNSRVTRDRSFVNQLYIDLLGRQADAFGLQFWTTSLRLGATRAQVSLGIQNSEEARARAVNLLYLNVMGRPARPDEVAFFVNSFNMGATADQIESVLLGSAEYFQAHGGTNITWLNSVYSQVLGRDVDRVGGQYYLAQLALKIPRELVAYQIVTSLEAQRVFVSNAYQQLLDREADAQGLTFFSTLLAQGVRATQAIIVSDTTVNTGFREKDVIAALTGSEEYFNQL